MFEAAEHVDVRGRILNVWTGGASDGEVLLYHPGTPFPPVRWPGLDELAGEMGLRLVTYARPGYSGSTRHPGRSVGDAAGDVAAVMDALGVGSFFALGHSGGGPHALACAALLSDRCVSAATLCSVAPFVGFETEWLTGMGEENIAEFGHVIGDPAGLEAYLAGELEAYADVTGEDIAAALGDLVAEVDRDALTGSLAEMFAEGLRRAAVDGLFGWVDDDLAFAKPWGVDLGSITVPVTIWQGRHDRMVPYSHGEYLVQHIPDARAKLLEDEGHLSLMTRRLREVLSGLVGRHDSGDE
jgi:pimeloyl-ACP methyl ester carboxylesterase